MASKGVIIGAVAIVAIIAVVGAAFMFMGEDEPNDPIVPPEPVKTLDYKTPEVGMKTTYLFEFESKYLSILSVPNETYNVFLVLTDDGEMEEWAYGDFQIWADLFNNDDMTNQLLESMGFSGIVHDCHFSMTGSILDDTGTLKQKDAIRVGDTMGIGMVGNVDLTILTVSGEDFTYSLMGEVYDSKDDNTDLEYTLKGTETITSPWGEISCEIYEDTAGNISHYSGDVLVKRVTGPSSPDKMSLEIVSSDMIEVIES